MTIKYDDVKPVVVSKPTANQVAVINGMGGRRPSTTVPGTITRIDYNDEQTERIDGAYLLDMVAAYLRYYGRWPDKESLVLASVYAAMTWHTDNLGRPATRTAPRLFFMAPKGSGKTRLMEEIQAISHDPTGILEQPITGPGLKEAADKGMTIFIDDAHALVGRGRGNAPAQGVMRSYRSGAGSLNARGGMNAQSTFSHMVIGAWPQFLSATGGQDSLVADIVDRSWLIFPKEHTNKKDKIPPLDDDFGEIAEAIGKALASWGAQNRPDRGKFLWPIHTIPDVLTSRSEELTAAMAAVADRAVGFEGDDRWAKLLRNAALKYRLDSSGDPEEALENIRTKMSGMGLAIEPM